MANSTKWLTSNSNIEYWIEYYTNSQSVSANTSSITVKLWIRRRNSGYVTYGSGTSQLKINGTTYNGAITASDTITSTARCLLNRTVTIAHNGDGTKVVPIECYITHSQFTTSRRSISYSLTTIPRASSVSCNDGNIGSATTINISRKSSSFTHTLTYSFSGISGTIATKTSSTSVGWTIPTSFYARIPNSKSGTVTVTCQTYSGNTLIGTTTTTATVTVTNSNPDASVNVYDTNATATAQTGTSSKLIKGISNPRVVTTAAGVNSATIKTIKVTCADGKSASGSYVTLNAVTSGSFTVVVTDSRGFVTTRSVSLTMVNYSGLAITDVNVWRLETTSSLTKIKVDAVYWNGNFGAKSNTRTLKYYWKESGTNTWSGAIILTATTVSGSNLTYEANLAQGFDINKGFDFLVRLEDNLLISDKTAVMGKSIPLIALRKDAVDINGSLKTGNFFKVDNEDGGDVAMELARGSLAYWKMLNTFGILKFQCDYNNSKGSYFDVLTMAHTTGNVNVVRGLLQVQGTNVIASGTNGNGTYVRFYDGTQICYYHGTSNSIAINSPYGSLYTGSYTWTYPASFIAAPSIQVSCRWGTGASWASLFETYTTNAKIRVWDAISRASGTTVTRSAIAIGKWK